jgi:hypothetical protein
LGSFSENSLGRLAVELGDRSIIYLGTWPVSPTGRSAELTWVRYGRTTRTLVAAMDVDVIRFDGQIAQVEPAA